MMHSTHPLDLSIVASGDASPVAIALLIGSILGLVALIIYLVWRHEKKRTEHLQQIAHGLDMIFFPKGDDGLQDGLGHFHLFSQGRAKKVRNLLHGEKEGVEISVLDYKYTVGSGKNSHTYNQSVICLRAPSLKLTGFELRPEHVFHKIGGAFGYQDIDFDSHPDFSKKYLLRGEDETAIRMLFNGRILSFFESQDRISVEGGGDQLIFYRHKNRVGPDNVHDLIREGVQVYDLFCGS